MRLTTIETIVLPQDSWMPGLRDRIMINPSNVITGA